MRDIFGIVRTAWQKGIIIPSFNVPYLPMMEPIVRAVAELDSFAMVAVARLEWMKFEAEGLGPVMREFQRWRRPEHVRLHLDHVPVIDEDGEIVDYEGIIGEAVDLGYDSVMVDGSRLGLDQNIEASRRAAALAHAAGVPCEAELGAVLGHEAGPMPPYEELFQSGRGFTDVEEAGRFVRETACDWLSVAIGNIHGAISGVAKSQSKPQARLNLSHLSLLKEATGVPLVLHGGSGIRQEDVLKGAGLGIAKVNVGTEIRQPYERTLQFTGSVAQAQQAVYEKTAWLLQHYFKCRRLDFQKTGDSPEN
jgi:fructose-bisphosphate aldolase, class II